LQPPWALVPLRVGPRPRFRAPLPAGPDDRDRPHRPEVLAAPDASSAGPRSRRATRGPGARPRPVRTVSPRALRRRGPRAHRRWGGGEGGGRGALARAVGAVLRRGGRGGGGGLGARGGVAGRAAGARGDAVALAAGAGRTEASGVTAETRVVGRMIAPEGPRGPIDQPVSAVRLRTGSGTPRPSAWPRTVSRPSAAASPARGRCVSRRETQPSASRLRWPRRRAARRRWSWCPSPGARSRRSPGPGSGRAGPARRSPGWPRGA